MRIFFLALLLSLAAAGLAVAQDSPSREPVILAANDGGPGGPPPGGPGAENATRPQGQSPTWGGQQQGSQQGGPGGPPPGQSDGQGRPSGPPPDSSGGKGGKGGPGGGMDHSAMTQACAGKSAGSDCCFNDPRGSQVCGQCSQSPRGDELVCRSARR